VHGTGTCIGPGILLAIEKGIIPSNMNFEKENEKLTLEKWNLKVILLCDKYVKIANMQ